jgi:GNAT superfamily N-acetyltransferase
MKPATVRALQPGDIPAVARVHVDTWRSSYSGIVPEAHLAGLSYGRCETNRIAYLEETRGETDTFVAEEETGEIAGFISGGPLREPLLGYDAELYVLYVRQAAQGSGNGRRMVAALARALAGRGYRALVVWVLRDNPACQFYEHLGGQPAGEKRVEIGGKELLDVAYAWPDLARLSPG